VALAAIHRPGDFTVEFNGELVGTLSAFTRRGRKAGEGAPNSLRIRTDGIEFCQGRSECQRLPATLLPKLGLKGSGISSASRTVVWPNEVDVCPDDPFHGRVPSSPEKAAR